LDGCIENQSQSLSEFVGKAKRLDPARRRSLVDAAVAAAEAEGWRRDESDRVMNGDELRLLAREGHEIASHTRTHPILPQLSPDALHDELAGAKADLEHIVGHEVVSLAYPNGEFNQDVIAAAQRAGYGNAVTTESGLNDALTDPYRMRRIFISQARTQGPAAAVSLPLLELELSGLADTLFLRRWRRS
jgi:peptidoglycan/xylan/chitin deacetylase (PgdA/CDA1 family)